MKRSILAIAAMGLLAGCTTVPNGQKNGTIVKLAQEGIFNKTWEAEIVRGGSYTGGTGVQGAAFDFTVSDPKLLDQVRDAFNSQKEVRITYYKTAWCPFSSENDCHFLKSIDVISEAQGGTVREGTDQPVAGIHDPAPTSNSVTSAQVDELLKQNAQLLNQNERMLQVLEKGQ